MFFHFVKYKLDTIKLKTKLFAKHPEKTREKVAEITIIPKTAPNPSLFFIFTSCYPFNSVRNACGSQL